MEVGAESMAGNEFHLHRRSEPFPTEGGATSAERVPAFAFPSTALEKGNSPLTSQQPGLNF